MKGVNLHFTHSIDTMLGVDMEDVDTPSIIYPHSETVIQQ